MIRPLVINACAYCGAKAECNYAIGRDGWGNPDAPNVPLCDACGSGEVPSVQDIWARIAMRDDDGTEWGPTVWECERELSGAEATSAALAAMRLVERKLGLGQERRP